MSSKMTKKMDDEKKKLHFALLVELSEHLSPLMAKYKIFLQTLRGYLPLTDVSAAKDDIFKSFDALERKGKLDVGEYDVLIEILKPTDVHMVEMVQKCKQNINNLSQSQEDAKGITDVLDFTSSFLLDTERKKMHYNLLAKLSEHLSPSMEEYETFLQSLKGYIPPSDVSYSKEDINHAFDALERKGALGVGKYDALTEILNSVDTEIAEIIQEYEHKMNNLLQGKEDVKGIAKDGAHFKTGGAKTTMKNVVDPKQARKKGVIEKLTSNLEASPHIRKRNDLIDKSNTIIAKKLLPKEEWVKVKAYGIVVQNLKTTGRAVIKGMPGNGKTTLACHVIHDIITGKQPDIRNKQPVVISKPSDWKDVNPCDNLIILIDDMFGVYSVSPVQEWKDFLDDTTRNDFNLDNGSSNVIIVTLRSEKYTEHISIIEFHPLFQSQIDLNSNQNFTEDEKLIIFRNYTSNLALTFTAEDEKSVIKTSSFIGFPQCCCLFKSNKKLQNLGLSFFTNPVIFLQRQLGEMSRNEKFSALKIIMMNGGKLQKSTCEGPNKESILRAARALEGTYLTYNKGIFSFSHDSIHDAIATFVWKDDMDSVIENCSADFLSTIRTHDDIGFEHAVNVAEKSSYSKLAKRILKEIKKKESHSYKCLAEMKIWSDIEFRREVDLGQTDETLDIDKEDENSHSLLYHAAKSGNVSLVRYILGKPSTEASKSQITKALNVACESSNFTLFEILRRQNTQANTETISSAIIGGNPKIFECIIEDFNSQASRSPKSFNNNNDSLTECLRQLFRRGRFDLFETWKTKFRMSTLLDSKNEYSLFRAAVEGGSLDIVKYLDNAKPVQISRADEDGTNILHLACEKGHRSIVEYLCKQHSELLTETGKRKYSALHYTADGTGSVDVSKYLVSKGVDVNTQDEVGGTVLDTACYNGHLDLVTYLCEYHPGLLLVTGECKYAALHYTAVGTGSVEVAKYLLIIPLILQGYGGV